MKNASPCVPTAAAPVVHLISNALYSHRRISIGKRVKAPTLHLRIALEILLNSDAVPTSRTSFTDTWTSTLRTLLTVAPTLSLTSPEYRRYEQLGHRHYNNAT